MDILISIGIFFTVILFIEGSVYTYHAFINPKNKAVKRRLRGVSPRAQAKSATEQAEVLRKRADKSLPWLEAFMAKIPRLDSLELVLQQANSTMPMGVFLLLSALLGSLSLIVAILKDWSGWVMLGCTVGSGIVPLLYMYRVRAQRFKQFQRQLPDALDLVARALRAGHSFSVGMKMVGDEFGEPIGPEFCRTIEEISYGIEIPEALKNLSNRVACTDLKFFVTSLVVQRETGGNLAEIFESISRLIRQRFELLGRVQALSAEGKLSAYILFGLPFGIAGILFVMNEGYMRLLFTDSWGHAMLAIAGFLMTLGAIVMKKMIAIKV